MSEPEFKKFGLVQKMAASPEDMAKVNAQALVELKEEDVFLFRVAACDDQPDRDNEQFTPDCLRELAKLFTGKTVILDHQWSATKQSARIYDASVERDGKVNRLVLRAYALRKDSTADFISNIEGGILREVSVGCAVSEAKCSICGTDRRKSWCDHRPGASYDGVKCVIQLSKPTDAYEVSFCAVPAQPGAGVVKSYGGEGNRPNAAPNAQAQRKALALLELAEKMF